MCKHAYKQFNLCVRAHIHTSNRVCLCVQISVWASFACLYLYLIIINLIGLKGPSPFTVASDHWGHSIILEFVKLYSSNASLFTFDRCKVYKVCSPMYVS